MALQAYKRFRFSDESLAVIDHANVIIKDYIAQGFRLTLRQLYYQFVARDLFVSHYTWTGRKWARDPKGTINAKPNYDMLGHVINDARLAGLIDWEAIEDRTRAFVRRQRWESGKQILESAASSFHLDMWENQPFRPFVIVEKEALVGVLERTCDGYDVPLLAARGYPSASILREFVVQDILPTVDGQGIVVIHLGDHDPSGLDMTRDLQERIELFCEGAPIELVRIALNMDQIEKHKPPPNPAKTTDSRFQEYREQFGDESWELDALSPAFLAKLVEKEVLKYCDADLWSERDAEAKKIRKKLTTTAKGFKA